MRFTTRLLTSLLALAVLLLAGCATHPDLVRLYADEARRDDAPPVIVIPGLMGTTLVDPTSGREVWPGSLAKLAFSDYLALSRNSPSGSGEDHLRPGELIHDFGGVDLYGALIQVLEQAGRYRRGTPGVPPAAGQRRQYYPFPYDWRRPNVEAVVGLHALIEQIRRDYGDPTLRVDIIAHSNGGLITNYYLRYGPTDVLDLADAKVWSEGELRVRRAVLLGTPNLGSATSLRRLIQGMRIGLREIPVELLATFATPFEALPHPEASVVFDSHGKPVAMDLYSSVVWRDNQWSVFDPSVIERVRSLYRDPALADAAVANLQAGFEANLGRAARFQRALAAPLPHRDLRMAAFGGDCMPTLSAAILQVSHQRAVFAFDAGDVDPGVPGVDYEGLLLAPGDGLVTRDSQDAASLGFVPLRQSFFLCERHELLMRNPYFQNNLLNFLLRG